MKKIKLYNLALLSLLGAFVSCNDDEDTTDARMPKSVVSLDQAAFVITEGQTATLTITTNQPINQRSDFKLEMVSGDASFRDFTVEGDSNAGTDDETTLDDGYGIIGHKVTLPAYATSATIDITAVIDYFVEGTETITFRLYPMGNSNTTVADEYFTVTINELVNDDLGIKLTWDKHYANAHGNIEFPTYTYVDANGEDKQAEFSAYDFDLYLKDDMDNEVYATYPGETGESPEEISTMGRAPLADGDYYVFVNLWSAGPTPKQLFNHDLKLDLTKYGVWATTIQIPLTSDEGFSDYVVGFTKAGSTYTVFDAYDMADVIITGKTKNKKAAIAARKLAKSRK